MHATTRKRVLEAACRLFAEKGYRGATIAAICRSAGANIAAVNYYFGNKAGLYEAAWEYADSRAREIYGGPGEAEDPRAVVMGHIRRLVLMIFDPGPGGWLPRLVRRDLATGGELTMRMYARFIAPRFRRLEEAVAALLGASREHFEVRCVSGYIQSMCVFLNIGIKARRHFFGAETPGSDQVERMIRNMQEFATGGLGRFAAPFDLPGEGGGGGRGPES